MAEYRLPYADVSGHCRGVSGDQFPPVNIRIAADNKDTTVVCDLLSTNKTCEAVGAGNETCLFVRPKTSQEVEHESILNCTTAAGTLIYDVSSREVITSPLLPEDHDQFSLPHSEGSILEELMRNQGKVLSRLTLIETFMASDHSGNLRAVDVNMARLRSKLGQKDNRYSTPDDQIIETIRHVGYKLTQPRNGRKG